MERETLILEKSDGIAEITMNRPEKRNALSRELLRDLNAALDDIQADHDIRVVILTGAGDSFSSGFDLTPGQEHPEIPVTAHWEAAHGAPRTLLRFWHLRQPTIAAVNGHAIAAGNVLALSCDLVIASERAQFAEPEVRNVQHSPFVFLPFLTAGKHLNYFYFSGDTFDARTFERWNLVNKVVPHEQLMEEARRMAQRIALVSPYAVQHMKRSIKTVYDTMGFTNAFNQHLNLRLIEALMPGVPEHEVMDAIRETAGMQAFLEARDGPFQ